MHKRKLNRGFTIVELLVVIVIIAILAAISLVAYASVTSRAVVASLQSDLSNDATILKSYAAQYGSYPTTLNTDNCPTLPTLDTNLCLKTSSGNSLSYMPSSTSNPANFSLYANNNSTYYRISSDSPISSSLTKTCPYGFIVVPGSTTYSTNDFCVMKYEAKADNGSGTGDTSQTTGYNTWPANTYPISSTRKLVSTAAGYPVAYISQTTSLTAASSYTTNCDTGCHLITEAEWLTIAQNVLSNKDNWSTGTVGSGYIPRGNSSSSAALEASSDLTGVNKRTLTLTNGEVIWDLAGNVWDWTSTSQTGGQPTGMASWNWYEWTAVSGGTWSSGISPYPADTGIPGASGWNSTQGIGKIYGLTSDASSRGFRRGGTWYTGGYAGVLALILSASPGYTSSYFGLRVSR